MSSEIGKVLLAAEERFVSVAPAHMQYDAEKGFAIQILKNSPYLMSVAQGHPASLQQAITNVAAIGLSLNPAEKLAYLIPRNIKTKDDKGRDKWENRVYLEPSYMGLIRLATDSGSIEWAQAKIVKEKDEFVDNGPGNKPYHTYTAFKERGEVLGVYCTAKTKTGDYLTSLMDLEKIHNIRGRSESYKKNSGPWLTDFEEMAKKAVIRNAFKTWPRTDERRMSIAAEAVKLSNENEGFEQIITEPTISEQSNEQKEYFDQMIEKNDALGMHLFFESFDSDQKASVLVSLMHSFPKGQKGKYQAVVTELRKQGQEDFILLCIDLRTHLDNQDDTGVIELVEGMDLSVFEPELTQEQEQQLREIVNDSKSIA